MGRHAVREADARQVAEALPSLAGKIDAVITSPPYATALPYLDTDRLSLVYLGLLPREHHRTRDTTMIGNREVTTGARTEYWGFFAANKSLLPRSVRGVIQRIDRLNAGGEAGFRRRNLPALLSKYFFDMREVMRQTFSLLRPGGTLFLVIGNNRTTAGGRPVEIRTADYLGEIAGDIRVPALGRHGNGHAGVAGHLQEERRPVGTNRAARQASVVAVPLLRIAHGVTTQQQVNGVLVRPLRDHFHVVVMAGSRPGLLQTQDVADPAGASQCFAS